MKISICEVCYYETSKRKLVEANRRVGFRSNIKIDTCDKHSSFFDNLNIQQANIKYLELLQIKRKPITV